MKYMDIDSLVRPNIRTLQPYTSARSLYQTGVFFDANENALGSVINAAESTELNRYPDPNSFELRSSLAQFLGVDRKNVFAGNGSDEIIDLLIRLFVNPNEEIVILEPTYGMYKVAANIAGASVKTYLLNSEFQIDLKTLLPQLTTNTKIVFCCSPNNPTGNLLRYTDIEQLCKSFNGIVVVDEAYIEFASSPSWINKVSNLENLVILRTFSKAWGLAGIRVGYAVANETLIQYLDKIKPPYNLNHISSRLALKALAQEDKMLAFRKAILEEREKLAKKLQSMQFAVFPSEANFLLVKYRGASEIAKKLAQRGIIIRDFAGKPMLADCVRISVATPEQNDLLISSLAKIL